MEPKIVEKEAFKIVGLRKTFTHATSSEIPALWGQFMEEIPKITQEEAMPVCFGACYFDPSQHMDENMEFEQIAAIELTEGREVPEGHVTRDVEGGKFAVFSHKGKLENLTETYNYIYGVWAQSGKVTLKAGHMFELYDERFKYGQDDSEMFIYVPIE